MATRRRRRSGKRRTRAVASRDSGVGAPARDPRRAMRGAGAAAADTRCLDCGAAIEARFCPCCGQKVAPARRPFFALIAEFWVECLALDGRLFRSLGPLLVRPGLLTRAYNAGRRTRYVSPVKLYLMTCFALFLAYAVHGWVAALRIDRAPAHDTAAVAATPPSRGCFFAEAFVFSLHVHAFTFLVFLVIVASGITALRALVWLVPIYFVLALARAFDLPWYVAILRSLALGIVFAPILLVALFAALVVAAGS